MRDIEELLKDLTPPQRAAATHIDGPLLIVAGAGSGKTRVITRRVAYLLAQGISASSILAITFTNKAAGEMKSRVASVIDRPLRDFGRLDQPWPLICTFHSLCLRILRYYSTQVGLPTNFSIYDTSDQTKVIKEALKMLDVSSQNFSPGTVHAAISKAKNELKGPEEFAQIAGDFFQRTVARVYTKYQQLLKQNNALDFDDLLLRTARAFRDHPDVLQALQERFQYLLIDEYQDTNHSQYILAHSLAHRHKNICVVGDPDQSIYAWRGADIQNIMDFEKDYPTAKIVRLEQNYRSTKRILRIASKLIANNLQRREKSLWTENAEGDPALLFLCQDEHDEARTVAAQLREMHDQHGHDWNKMAIFYRMNALSRVMEGELVKAGLPYQIARGVEFYNRKEIKDALAFLRVVANSNDEMSLTRIANVPARGLGDAAIKQMAALGVANGISLWQAMERAGSIPEISSRAANAARQFVELVNRWRGMAYRSAGNLLGAAGIPGVKQETVKPSVAAGGRDLFSGPEEDPFGPSDAAVLDELDLENSGSSDAEEPVPVDVPQPVAVRGNVRAIAEAVIRQSGLEDYLRKIGGDELDELNNVNELISSAAEFDNENPEGSLADFLAQVSLVSDADHMEGAGGAITLMTLHAAKGLEFPVVAMIGLEEGVLPHSRSRGNLNELEEERRLCFVGITRAQERLILSKAARRTIRGISERTITSPFINEMPAEDLQVTDRTGIDSYSTAGPTKGYNFEQPQSKASLAAGSRFSHMRSGQLVRHPQFGIGRIREIEETGEQRTRAMVQFNAVGLKTLFLEFAKLEVIE